MCKTRGYALQNGIRDRLPHLHQQRDYLCGLMTEKEVGNIRLNMGSLFYFKYTSMRECVFF